MKNIFITFALLLSTISIFAQAPQGINYQAVARKTNGEPIVNTNVNVQFRILNGGVFGTEVYREEHSTTSNAFGLFTLKIGGGRALNGTFANINWGNGAKFLEVTVQSSFGTVTGGATEMLSVPFAMYAASAPGTQGQKGDKGDTGAQGPQGQKGDKGDTGAPGSAVSLNFAVFEETLAHGQSPPFTGSFTKRKLNTTVFASPSVVLVGDNIKFNQTGKYLITASAPAFQADRHRLCLRRDNNTVAMWGSSEYSSASEHYATKSTLVGILEVTSVGNQYYLDHYAQNITTGRLGVDADLPAPNTTGKETFAQIMIQKIQ